MRKKDQKAGRFEATILFCDIRGFTALFDQRDPLEALAFANSVIGELGAVVEACNGTVDKFTGDGFLAHFGIINTDGKHAEEACWCAIRMRSALSKINSARYLSDQPVVSIGVGIHSGLVAAGAITTMYKTEFTVLGSVVNLASRIEGLTKVFSVDCLMSEQTLALVGDRFLVKSMPVKAVAGVAEPIKTSWILPMNLWPY